MKTVSTKLDNKLHNRFLEICNKDGKCQSEFLRDLIETVCEDCSENNKIYDLDNTEPEAEPVAEPVVTPISEAKVTKISHDNGETWYDVKPTSELTNVIIND